jgi:hypothetical protein
MSKVKLSGLLDGDLRWMRHRDVTVPGSPSVSDLYIREVAIGVEASLVSWGSAIAVLNSEWIGDTLNRGNEQLAVDEVHFDLNNESFPAYLVLGKRTQPFGLFEQHLVTDPLTQDAYETKRVAVTVGHARENADLSITAYRGTELMDHLFGSGLVDTTAVHRRQHDVRNVDSFIASASLSPWAKHLTVFGAISDEPGADRRNVTANAGFALSRVSGVENVNVDAEFVRALQRETYVESGRVFKENVLSVSVAYEFVLRDRVPQGGANYRARKSHRHAHPFEAGVRYEYFGDDSMSAVTGGWSAKSRLGVGGRVTMHDDGTVLVFSAVEYRHSEYREGSAGSIDPANDEVYLRLGIDF